MAKKNRADIQTAIDTLLPTGGTGIPSVDLRSLEADFKDSNFNLTDDDTGDIIVENGNTETLKTRLDAIQIALSQATKTIRRGHVNIGNAFGLTAGSNLGVDTGGDITAIVASSNNTDTLITISFTNNIGSQIGDPSPSNSYKVNPTFISLGANFDSDNDIAAPIIKNKTSSSFQIGLRTLASATRDIRIEFEVNEFIL